MPRHVPLGACRCCRCCALLPLRGSSISSYRFAFDLNSLVHAPPHAPRGSPHTLPRQSLAKCFSLALARFVRFLAHAVAASPPRLPGRPSSSSAFSFFSWRLLLLLPSGAPSLAPHLLGLVLGRAAGGARARRASPASSAPGPWARRTSTSARAGAAASRPRPAWIRHARLLLVGRALQGAVDEAAQVGLAVLRGSRLRGRLGQRRERELRALLKLRQAGVRRLVRHLGRPLARADRLAVGQHGRATSRCEDARGVRAPSSRPSWPRVR